MRKWKKPALFNKIKRPAFLEKMSKKQRRWLCIALTALVTLLLVWWASHVQFFTKIWYLLPSSDEYYVYVPTDYAPEEMENCTLKLTKLTGFGEKTITGDYWPEENCFHAIVEDRGIYKIKLHGPDGIIKSVHAEIGRDQIYVVPFYRGPVLPLPEIPANCLEWNGHRYWVMTFDHGWETAQKQLERIGAHLATITSKEENEAIYAYIAERGIGTAYFGLSVTEGTQDWHWVTGEPMDYSNWHEGEPNDQSECYGQFFSDFQASTWNNAHAPGPGSIFICEMDGLD